MDKAERIMKILYDELNNEKECYLMAKTMMKKSFNPIRKYRNKKGLDMFEHHIAALSYAIIRIEKSIK